MPLLRCVFSRSLRLKSRLFSSKPSTSLGPDSNDHVSIEPSQERPEKAPFPTDEEIKLNKEMLKKLERLSGLRFRNLAEIENLQADIRLANKLFEVNTDGVEPMYSVVEELINCPLREDVPGETSAKKVLMNASVVYEDLFVTPKPNIPMTENPLFEDLHKLDPKKGSGCSDT